MKKILLILLTSFITLGCQTKQDPRIKVLNTAEYKKEIEQGNIQLVDVRTAGEYKSGAITGALNIDVTNGVFDNEIQKLDKTKPVYIYCRSGARSQAAARKMVALGFTQIIDLRGGYLSWN